MASSKSTASVADEEKRPSLTVIPGGAPPAELMEEMEGLAGAGTSSASDDNVIPFVVLFQDNNPQVKKREAKYVQGAEPGCLFNQATRQLWFPDPETGYYFTKNEDGSQGEQLLLQPCVFQRAVVVWPPRDAGVGHPVDRCAHPLGAAIEETMRKLNGVQVSDPRDSSGRKKLWRDGTTPDANELVDTRYHYVNVVHEGERTEPALFSFSSTGHQTSKGWMTLMRNSFVGANVAPSWFKKYPVRSVVRQDSQNSWFVLAIDDGTWIVDKEARARGKEFATSVNSGAVRAAEEGEGDGAPGAGDADLPI